jgi:hypothetical protein
VETNGTVLKRRTKNSKGVQFGGNKKVRGNWLVKIIALV